MIHQETHFENKNEANKKMFKLSLNRNGMWRKCKKFWKGSKLRLSQFIIYCVYDDDEDGVDLWLWTC
jgi:hypothetical protein